MAQITYTDKVALNENPEIAAINKVSDDDMNEIKSVVNANYNQTIQITDTQPSDNNCKLWIDTGEIAQQVSEITNSYSTSTGIGYSANYLNDKIIAESGSNTNGYYIKYADGTLICTKSITGTLGGNAWGNVYYSDHSIGNWAYTFTTIYAATASVEQNQYWCNLCGYSFDSVRVFRPNSSTSDGTIRIMAIGRWKA